MLFGSLPSATCPQNVAGGYMAHLATVKAEQLCAEREITSSLDRVAIAAAIKLRGITVHQWKIQSKAKDAYLKYSNYPECDMYFHVFIQ